MISRRRILTVIALLSAAGMALSMVSLQHHYVSSTTSFCDFGANFNCDIVNRSIYSEIFGVPVALIGLLGYAALLTFALFYRKSEDAPVFLVAASFAGLAFALYLTYIEAFVLDVWCVLCLSSLGLILAVAFLSAMLMWYSQLRS
ncbi:MAG: vitamin K epoxide reductase family protein [Terriglobales bacterium]